MASIDLAPPLPSHPAQHPSGATADLSKDMFPTNIPVSQTTSDTLPSNHPSTASTGTHPNLASKAPTSTIDPNVPSSVSAPTALPTNAATHPQEQKEALKGEHPHVVAREVEKVKAAERELKGEKPKGTIVKGVEDDRLYAMLRRFDVDVTHVLHPATHLPLTEPDLRMSRLPHLPAHSEVVKTNLERLIAAIGPSSIRGAREAQRMMSWSPEERFRTGCYCTAYFICWVFGYTILGVSAFFMGCICFPGTRRYLFPAIPPPPFTPVSATDPTGKKGDESLLGNVDSKTVHRSKAEQAEEQAFEATSILQAFTTRLIFDGKKTGKHAGNSEVGEKTTHISEDDEDGDDDDDDLSIPEKIEHPDKSHSDITAIEDQKPQGLQSADVVVGGKKIEHDEKLSEKKKKKLAQQEAKKKRDELVSKMTKATETGLGSAADMFEIMTNALSPPSCYPDRLARFKIASAFILPPALLLTFVPAWVFARSATFLFGVVFWGQPILMKMTKKLISMLPDNWEELIDIRNSILSGVPTDAQLTLHILRVAEALDAPLPRPPPPPLKGTPKEAIKDTAPPDITAEDEAEIEAAEEDGSKTDEVMTKAKVKSKGAIVGAFKGIGKKMAGFRGDVSVDGARKQIGSKIDKVFFQGSVKDTGTIDSYPCKLDGVAGHIILENKSDTLLAPQVSFVPISGVKEHFVWPLDDIVEIKKSYVSMGRIALGWASGADIEGLGLTIRFKSKAEMLEDQNKPDDEKGQDGTVMHFKRVGRREQLFVRLVSMGAQRWEVL